MRYWWIYKKIPFLNLRASFINNLREKGRLLDIGCGEGTLIRRYLELRPDIDIFAIDCVDFGEMLPESVKFKKIDIRNEKLPFPNDHFDAVTCIHVLEHLSSHTLLLEEVKRVCKPDAKIYFETPNIRSMFVPSFPIQSKSGEPLNFYDDPTHIRPFSKYSLTRLFSQKSFRVLKSCNYRNYLFTALSPFLIFFGLILWKRKLFAAGLHHLISWSCSAIVEVNKDTPPV